MKFADFKCEKCGKLYEDLELYKEHKCKCGQNLKRIYSYNNFPEFIPDFYENFEHNAIWIESRKQFKNECKKRNLERVY